jgi:hypothetical protein
MGEEHVCWNNDLIAGEGAAERKGYSDSQTFTPYVLKKLDDIAGGSEDGHSGAFLRTFRFAAGWSARSNMTCYQIVRTEGLTYLTRRCLTYCVPCEHK